jgi:uncharacterized protein (DUF488 family)
LAIEILTVGHSTRDYEGFLGLLREAEVSAVADVRTHPYSRQFPHFNRETLKAELRTDGIAYVFLGDELGGRPRDIKYYCDGAADYEKMATDENFKKGIDRVLNGAKQYRIALMCSEGNPLDCHRCLLVGRALSERGADVQHIVASRKIISQQEIEEQLIRECGHGGDDMFAKGEQRLAEAYRERSRLVSFRSPDLQNNPNPEQNR